MRFAATDVDPLEAGPEARRRGRGRRPPVRPRGSRSAHGPTAGGRRRRLTVGEQFHRALGELLAVQDTLAMQLVNALTIGAFERDALGRARAGNVGRRGLAALCERPVSGRAPRRAEPAARDRILRCRIAPRSALRAGERRPFGCPRADGDLRHRASDQGVWSGAAGRAARAGARSQAAGRACGAWARRDPVRPRSRGGAHALPAGAQAYSRNSRGPWR